MAARTTTSSRKERRGKPVSTGAPKTAPSGWQTLGLWGVLLAAWLAAHAGAMTATLTGDERRLLIANPAIEQAGAWYRPWGEFSGTGYHPLGRSWLAVEGRWLESEAAGHRLVGESLHLACVALLWQVARRVGHPAGWLAALAWAVHPLAVDAATWIPGRGTLLAALGMLVSARCFVEVVWRGDEEGEANAELDRSSWQVCGWLAGCWLAGAGALWADSSAAALPAVLWGLAGRRGAGLSRMARVAKGGVWLAALVAVTATLFAGLRRGGGSEVWDWFAGLGPGLARFVVAVVLPGWYGFTWPQGPFWEDADWTGWGMTGALLLAMVGVGWRARSSRMRHAVRGLGCGVTLWVASGLPSPGWELAPSAGARGYAALGALCLVIAAAWPKNLWRVEFRRRLVALGLGAVLGVGSILAGSERSAAWRDGERLWQWTLVQDAGSWLAHVNLAGHASLSGQSEAVIKHLEQARYFAPGAAETEALLAQELAVGGQFSRALAHLARARERAPYDARLAMAEGDVHRLGGQTERALRTYQEAAALAPHWPRPLLAEASVQAQRGMARAAVTAAERAVAMARGAAWVRMALAGVRREAGDLAGAEQEFRQVLRQDARDVAARLGLADILLRGGRADEAEVQLRVAGADLTQDDRRRALWIVLRAEVLRQRGDRAGAEGLLREALRRDLNQVEAYLSLGRLREEGGDFRAAVSCYRQAWQRAPERRDLALRLAEAYRAAGQAAEAELLYQQMVAEHPSSADGYVGLGRVAAAKGELAAAEAQLRQALALDSTRAEAALELGLVLEQQTKPEEALAAYRQAVAARPAWSVAQKHLGTLLAQQGVPFEAIAALRKAVALDPDYGEAHRALATVLAMQNSPEEAVRHFREAVRLAPTDAVLRYNLGTLLGQRGRAEEGLAELREAVRLRPEYPEAQHNLAVLLAQTGKAQEASAAYQETLRLDPRHAEAHGNYAQLLLKQGLWEEALAHLRASLQIRAEQPAMQGRLAWLLATLPLDRLRNGAEAVSQAEAACQATERRDARLLDVLAAAYAEAGRFEEALATAREALTRLGSGGDLKLAEGIAGRIKQYELRNPYRESP